MTHLVLLHLSHLEDLHGKGLRERIEKHIHTVAHGKAGYTVPWDGDRVIPNGIGHQLAQDIGVCGRGQLGKGGQVLGAQPSSLSGVSRVS